MVQQAGVQPGPDVVDRTRRLGRHYIAARYPDAHAGGPAASHYGSSDSRQAIEDAEAILRFVDESWSSIHG
jgi:HEPN domain-containing protein